MAGSAGGRAADLGVVAGLTPYNDLLNLVCARIQTSDCCRCTDNTPAGTRERRQLLWELSRLAAATDLPAGMVQVITGGADVALDTG